MGADSKIEWTDHTFNPWMGCTKVSQGCKFCYAEEQMDRRYKQVKWGPDGERKRTSAATWAKPLQWDRDAQAEGKRARVFCASLADVFEQSPELDRIRVDLWRLIEHTPNLDWQLLTKRPQNIMAMVPPHWHDGFPPNVWIGTSVEDQDAADKRIPELLKVRAAVRFLSCEPLLGPVTFRPEWFGRWTPPGPSSYAGRWDSVDLHWVIIGGESGHNARPMHPDWARSLRDQCVVAGVPVLFKQAGTVLAKEWGCSDNKGHNLDEMPHDLRIRQFPEVQA